MARLRACESHNLVASALVVLWLVIFVSVSVGVLNCLHRYM